MTVFGLVALVAFLEAGSASAKILINPATRTFVDEANRFVESLSNFFLTKVLTEKEFFMV